MFLMILTSELCTVVNSLYWSFSQILILIHHFFVCYPTIAIVLIKFVLYFTSFCIFLYDPPMCRLKKINGGKMNL